MCGYGLCECLRECLCVVYFCVQVLRVCIVCAPGVCVCVCECMCVSVSDLRARMCEGLRVVALRVCMWVFWCSVVYVGKCACVYLSVSVLVYMKVCVYARVWCMYIHVCVLCVVVRVCICAYICVVCICQWCESNDV